MLLIRFMPLGLPLTVILLTKNKGVFNFLPSQRELSVPHFYIEKNIASLKQNKIAIFAVTLWNMQYSMSFFRRHWIMLFLLTSCVLSQQLWHLKSGLWLCLTWVTSVCWEQNVPHYFLCQFLSNIEEKLLKNVLKFAILRPLVPSSTNNLPSLTFKIIIGWK